MSDRQSVADDISRDLQELELAVEGALSLSAYFLARLPARRAAANLSPAAAQKVFGAALEASARLTDARGAMVETHNGMEALRRALKLQPATRMDDMPPPDKPENTAANPLRVVAERTAA